MNHLYLIFLSYCSCNTAVIFLWFHFLFSWRCSCRWGETMSLNCGHQGAYCLSSPVIYEHGQPWWNDTDRENRRTRRKTWADPGPDPGLRGEPWHGLSWSYLFTYRCETFSAYNGYLFKRSVTKHLCIQRATRPVFRASCFLGTVAAPKRV
jgi:hypothetical protein